jgi:hypothetical protein
MRIGSIKPALLAGLAALAILAPVRFAAQDSTPRIAGRWQWEGPAGWQRITLDLEVDGTGKRLSGRIRLGPGSVEPVAPDRYWEYFFEPLVSGISEGRVDGARISFEQEIEGGAGGDEGEVLVYSGAVDGDLLHLTRSYDGTLRSHRAEFTLERVP